MAELGPKATVERALKRYRYLASQHVWGGMHDDYELAKAALAVLDELVEARQLMLIGDADGQGQRKEA